jgi:hypothetical protein
MTTIEAKNNGGRLPYDHMVLKELRVIYQGPTKKQQGRNGLAEIAHGDLGIIEAAWLYEGWDEDDEKGPESFSVIYCQVRFAPGLRLKIQVDLLESAPEGYVPPSRPLKAKNRRALDRARSGRFGRESYQKEWLAA